MSNDQPRDPQGHYLPHGSTPAGPPPKKKGGCLKIGAIIAGLIVLLLVLAGACSAMFAGGGEDTSSPGTTVEETTEGTAPQEQEPTQEQEAEQPPVLRLEATSTSSGESSANWFDLDGSMNSENFVGTWTKEIPLTDTDDRYNFSITPNLMDTSAATVTCKLYIDDELVDEATATGDGYASASCSQPLF